VLLIREGLPRCVEPELLGSPPQLGPDVLVHILFDKAVG
jgi:hypothetical protein